MNKSTEKYLILSLLLYFYPSLGAANTTEAPWEVWAQNSELAVSYRPAVALNKKLSAELIEIKAVVKVNSTLAGFLLFLQQVENTPNWLVNSTESKVIESLSSNETIFFTKFSGVWPLKQRLLILHSNYWQNEDLSVEISLSDARNITDENIAKWVGGNSKQYLRITTYYAHWKITAIQANAQALSEEPAEPLLLIEYTFIGDGNGDSPPWLVKHFTLKSMWKSMHNLKRQLPHSEFQQETIEGIIELNVGL